MGQWSKKAGPAMARLTQAMKDAEKIQGKTGWLPSSRYEDGTPVAYIAAIQEYGDPENNLPSRSFMRTTFDAENKKWSAVMRSGVKGIASGKTTVSAVMETIALLAAADIRLKIASIHQPELAPSTLAARASRANAGSKGKKFTAATVSQKPLNDTGYMLATLVGVIEETK